MDTKLIQPVRTLMKGEHPYEPPQPYARRKHGPAKASFTSTRNAVHRDRRIQVRTTYRIEIDGAPVRVHTSVADDGSVHCHGLPTYSFASAVDLARALIDASLLRGDVGDDLGGSGDGGGGNHGGGHH